MALVGTSSQMLALQRPVSGKLHRASRTTRTTRIVARSSNDQPCRARPGERRQLGLDRGGGITIGLVMPDTYLRDPRCRLVLTLLIRHRTARLPPCIMVSIGSYVSCREGPRPSPPPYTALQSTHRRRRLHAARVSRLISRADCLGCSHRRQRGAHAAGRPHRVSTGSRRRAGPAGAERQQGAQVEQRSGALRRCRHVQPVVASGKT